MNMHTDVLLCLYITIYKKDNSNRFIRLVIYLYTLLNLVPNLFIKEL